MLFFRHVLTAISYFKKVKPKKQGLLFNCSIEEVKNSDLRYQNRKKNVKSDIRTDEQDRKE